MQQVNHHAHSCFSDGQLHPQDYVQEALLQALEGYGFADHAPIPGASISLMSLDDLNAYNLTIDQLKNDYGHRIRLYKALEVDYIPGLINVQSPHIQQANLDYTVGAVHYVDQLNDGTPWGFEASVEHFQRGISEAFGGDIQAAVCRYYALIREMVTDFPPDIVAHLDRIKKLNQQNRFFNEYDEWYRNEIIDTLEVIAEAGVIMEVNTKGYYNGEIDDMYPSGWILEIAHEMDIPVHLASDAHHPLNITKGFNYGAEILHKAGYRSLHVMGKKGWTTTPISALVI